MSQSKEPAQPDHSALLLGSHLDPSDPHIPAQGSYEGLRAWGICQLVRLGAAEAKKGKKGAKASGALRVIFARDWPGGRSVAGIAWRAWRNSWC